MRPSTPLTCSAHLSLVLFALFLIASSAPIALARSTLYFTAGNASALSWIGTCGPGLCSRRLPCNLASNSLYNIKSDVAETCELVILSSTGNPTPMLRFGDNTPTTEALFSIANDVLFSPTIQTTIPFAFNASNPNIKLSGTVKTICSYTSTWPGSTPLATFKDMTLSAFAVTVASDFDFNPTTADLPPINILFNHTTLDGLFLPDIPIVNISTRNWGPSGAPPANVNFQNVTFNQVSVAPALVSSDSAASTTLVFQGGQGSIGTESLLTMPNATSGASNLDITFSFNAAKLQMRTTQLIKQIGANGLELIMESGADLEFGSFGAAVYDILAPGVLVPSWTLNSTWSYLYGLDLSKASVIGCQACTFVNCKFIKPETTTKTKFEVSNLGTSSHIKLSNEYNPIIPGTASGPYWSMQDLDLGFVESLENFGQLPPSLTLFSDLPVDQSFLFEGDMNVTTSIGPNCTIIFDLKVAMTENAKFASGCSLVFNDAIFGPSSASITAIGSGNQAVHDEYPSLSLRTFTAYNVTFNLGDFSYVNVNVTVPPPVTFNETLITTPVAAYSKPLQRPGFRILWSSQRPGVPPPGHRMNVMSLTAPFLVAEAYESVPSLPSDLSLTGGLEFTSPDNYIFFIQWPLRAPTVAPVAGSRCPPVIPAGFTCVNGILVSEGSVTIGPGSNTTTLIVTTANVLIQGNLTVSNGSQIIFTDSTHIIDVQGCVELANGSFVLIDLSETKIADLPSGSRVILSQSTNCTNSLQAIEVQLKKPKDSCEKVTAKKTNEQTANALTVLFVTDSSPCNTKWIIVGAVLGGVVVIAVVATVVTYTIMKKKNYRKAKDALA